MACLVDFSVVMCGSGERSCPVFGEFSTVSASEGSVVEVFLLLFVLSESVGWAVVWLSCNGCLVFSVKIRSFAFLLNLIKILSKERSILSKNWF